MIKKRWYAGFLFFVLGGTATAENILDNGDFEANLKKWATVRSRGAAGSVVDSISYGGKKALCMFREDDKRNYIYCGIILKKDREYRLSVAIKCVGVEKDDICIHILARKQGKDGKYKPAGWISKHGVHKLILTGGSHDWKEFSTTITRDMIPDEAERFNLIIERKNNGKGKIYVDDLVLEPIAIGKQTVTTTQQSVAPATVTPVKKMFTVSAQASTPVINSPLSPVNLLPFDTSFETNTGGAAVPADSTYAWHGKYALLLPADLTACRTVRVPLIKKNNRDYVFSFYAMSNKAVRVNFYVSNDFYGKCAYRSIRINKEWKRYIFNLRPEKNTTGISVNFQKPKGVKIWLDSFALTAGKKDVPYTPSAPISLGFVPIEPIDKIAVIDNQPLTTRMGVCNNTGKPQKLKITALLNGFNQPSRSLEKTVLTLAPGELWEKNITIQKQKQQGYWVMRLTAETNGKKYQSSQPVVVLPLPSPASRDSFFGLHSCNGYYGQKGRKIGASISRAFDKWRHHRPDKQGQYHLNANSIRELTKKTGMEQLRCTNLRNPPFGIPRQGYFARNPDDMAKWIQALTKVYRGCINFVELQNEPDLSYQNHVEKYVDLVNMLAPQVRKVDSNFKILAAGVSGVDFNSHFQFLKRVLKKTGKNIDIVAVHPYSINRYIVPEGGDVGPEASGMYGKTLKLKKIIRQLGGHQPVWYGEVGWGVDVREDFLSDCAQRHAAYMVRTMLIGLAAGVEKCIYFQVNDVVEKESQNYGLWQYFQPMPATVAYAATVQLLEKAKFLDIVHNRDLHCYMFRHRDGRLFFAVWVSTDDKTVFKTKLDPRKVEIRDMMNNPVKLDPNKPVELKLSGNVLYGFARDMTPDELKKILSKARYELPPLRINWSLKNGNDLQVALTNVRTQSLAGTVKIDGARFSQSEQLFQVKPGSTVYLRFKAPDGLRRNILKLTGTCNVGKFASSFTCSTLPCVQGTPSLTTGSVLPAYGRLPQMDSRKNLLPNDPGNGWTGPGNLSVDSVLCYDRNNLYLLADVRDDTQYQKAKPGRLWSGDSIQLAIDTGANAAPNAGYDKDDYEFGFGLTPSGPQKELTYIYQHGRAQTVQAAIKSNIFRQGDRTCYRIAIPWSVLKINPAKGAIFGLNFTANDHDGARVRFYMGLTPGIVESKNPYVYRKFILE